MRFASPRIPRVPLSPASGCVFLRSSVFKFWRTPSCEFPWSLRIPSDCTRHATWSNQPTTSSSSQLPHTISKSTWDHQCFYRDFLFCKAFSWTSYSPFTAHPSAIKHFYAVLLFVFCWTSFLHSPFPIVLSVYQLKSYARISSF